MTDDVSEPDEAPQKPRRRARIRPGYVRLGRPPKKRELISPKMLKLLREKLGPSPGPLEVLQMAMDWYLDKGDIDAASKLAKDLAAYKIPKPAPVDSEGRAAIADKTKDMTGHSHEERVRAGFDIALEDAREANWHPDEPFCTDGQAARHADRAAAGEHCPPGH